MQLTNFRFFLILIYFLALRLKNPHPMELHKISNLDNLVENISIPSEQLVIYFFIIRGVFSCYSVTELF